MCVKLRTVMGRECRATIVSRRNQEAASLLQQLKNSLLNLAVLVTSLDRRSSEVSDKEQVQPTLVPCQSATSASRVSIVADESIRTYTGCLGRVYVPDAVVSATLHLVSLFHAVVLSTMCSNEGIATFRVRFIISSSALFGYTAPSLQCSCWRAICVFRGATASGVVSAPGICHLWTLQLHNVAISWVAGYSCMFATRQSRSRLQVHHS